MPLNALVINDWISNRVAGGTYRVQGFAEGFAALGFRVFITTPWGITEYNKVNEVHQPNVGSPLYYATTSMMLPLQVIRSLMKTGSVDLVLVQMPSPFTKALPILPILKLIDAPLVLDFGDPWWKNSDPELYRLISSKVIQLQSKESMLISSSSKLILKLINHENKVWIPNGVSPEFLKSRNISPHDELVGFLGSFTRRNGVDLIIPMLSRLIKSEIDAKFMLVGGGDLLPIIREEAAKIGLSERIIFTGNVPRHEIPHLLSMCSILVAPYMESPELHFIFPTKVPEMMALRRPVVTARLYEIITTFKVNEEILVAKYDVTDYVNKIMLLINDNYLRHKIAENGYMKVSEDFTWERLTLRIIDGLRGSL
jgi:glycosyltransferase involved in cell wall biosynthesis